MLLHPTYLGPPARCLTPHAAIEIANHLLNGNGMSDLAAYVEYSFEAHEFFRCGCAEKKDKRILYGGGAMLIVRKSDGLAGMAYFHMDFMKPDYPGCDLAIADAFEAHPPHR